MLFGDEYNFGLTIEFAIKVLDYYNVPKQGKKVVILSRNNPLEFQCQMWRKREAGDADRD